MRIVNELIIGIIASIIGAYLYAYVYELYFPKEPLFFNLPTSFGYHEGLSNVSNFTNYEDDTAKLIDEIWIDPNFKNHKYAINSREPYMLPIVLNENGEYFLRIKFNQTDWLGNVTIRSWINKALTAKDRSKIIFKIRSNKEKVCIGVRVADENATIWEYAKEEKLYWDSGLFIKNSDEWQIVNIELKTTNTQKWKKFEYNGNHLSKSSYPKFEAISLITFIPGSEYSSLNKTKDAFFIGAGEGYIDIGEVKIQ